MPEEYLPAHEVTGPADAPVVLMGSSLGTDRHMWDAQVPALAERYRVVRYELRGHGASTSPASDGPASVDDLGADLVRLMDHLGIARAHHVGLSIGGMLALWMAEHHPDRVDSLAVLCSSAYLPPAEGWLARAATARAEGMGAIVDAVMARWFTQTYDDETTRAALQRTFLAVEPEGYAQCCEAIAGMDLRPGLAGITAPALVVAGRDDAAIPALPTSSSPAWSSRETAEAMTGAQVRFELLDDAAHIAAVQQHATVTRLLLDHLER